MPDIKMIALDLDGTVFNDARQVTPRVRQALSDAIAAGVVVLPATGRPKTGLPEELMAIPGVRYAITSNGAVVYDAETDQDICRNCMDNESAVRLLTYTKTFKGLSEVYVDGKPYADGAFYEEALRYNTLPPAILEYVKRTRIPVNDILGFMAASPFPAEKVHLLFGDLEERARCLAGLKENFSDYVITSAYMSNIEVNGPGCDKGAGILMLADYLGIDHAATMACGDSLNDLAMIKAAGLGVAMGNSDDIIKEAADVITLTNEEDGVADAIYRYVLK